MKSFLLFFIALFIGCNSKDESQLKQIEIYLDKSDDYYDKNEYVKSLDYAKKAYDLSKMYNEEKYLSKSCLNIAKAVSDLEMNNLALSKIDEGRKYCDKNDYLLLSQLENAEAYVLTDLNIQNQAISNYYAVINRLTNHLDKNGVKEELFRTYQDIGTSYYALGEKDSVEKYNKMTEALIPHISHEKNFRSVTFFYYNRGADYLEEGKRDSAMIAFEKCRKIDEKHKEKSIYMSYLGLADYYQSEDPERSLSYYLKLVEHLESMDFYMPEFTNVYKVISTLYEMKGGFDKQNEYLKKYQSKLETDKKNRDKSLQQAITILLNKKDKKHNL